MRASSVVKRQSALAWRRLRCLTQAPTSRDEGFVVWDAPIEALGSEDGEFGFCQIEPGAMLGRVDPFEAVDEAASLGRGEGFVERRLGVDVQVVLEQSDDLGIGKVGVGDVP